MQRFFCFLNAYGAARRAILRGGLCIWGIVVCMFSLVCIFKFGSENRFSRAMRAILPVRFSLFSEEKARKMREKHIFRWKSKYIFDIYRNKKGHFQAQIGRFYAGSIGICNSCNKVWSGKKVGAGNGSGRNKVWKNMCGGLRGNWRQNRKIGVRCGLRDFRTQ